MVLETSGNHGYSLIMKALTPGPNDFSHGSTGCRTGRGPEEDLVKVMEPSAPEIVNKPEWRTGRVWILVDANLLLMLWSKPKRHVYFL